MPEGQRTRPERDELAQAYRRLAPGLAAERARGRGVTHFHVTLTHSAGVAAAAVILEG